jgi:hypothetical protein
MRSRTRHAVERLVHLRDDVDAVDDERALARHAQRDVEDGAVLGRVDRSPRNIASVRSASPDSSASWTRRPSVSSTTRIFE